MSDWLPCKVLAVDDIADATYDALLVVAPSMKSIGEHKSLDRVTDALQKFVQVASTFCFTNF
jgi:hypothetical protein